MRQKRFIFILGLILAVSGARADWEIIEFPGASQTWVASIDGSNIAGLYKDDTGNYSYYFDGVNWKSLFVTDSFYTMADGVSGETVVGTFIDQHYFPHGFISQEVSLQGDEHQDQAAAVFEGAHGLADDGAQGSLVVLHDHHMPGGGG